VGVVEIETGAGHSDLLLGIAGEAIGEWMKAASRLIAILGRSPRVGVAHPDARIPWDCLIDPALDLALSYVHLADLDRDAPEEGAAP
jgi:hypothetical protein